MGISIFIRDRRYGRNELVERHISNEFAKACKTVCHTWSDSEIGVSVNFTADFVTVTRHQTIPRIADKSKCENTGKQLADHSGRLFGFWIFDLM